MSPNDQQLVELLKSKGYSISKVAKIMKENGLKKAGRPNGTQDVGRMAIRRMLDKYGKTPDKQLLAENMIDEIERWRQQLSN